MTVQVHTGEGALLRITWDEAWGIKARAVTRGTVRAGARKCDASEVRIQTVRGEPASTGLSAGFDFVQDRLVELPAERIENIDPSTGSG